MSLKTIKNTQQKERLFQSLLSASGVIILVLVIGVFITLLIQSMPAIIAHKFDFFSHTTWDPVSGQYGGLSFLVGTLLTAFLALLISIPFSLSIAIVLGEYLTEGWIALILKTAIDLLAGIPSVIYGFWGLFVLAPWIRNLEIKLGVLPYGVGILTASLILALMIIPYAASLGREVIRLVPAELKEASLSLGATRYETVRKIILPYAKSGISAGFLLSLGRALSETMAVTMVIGNSNLLPTSIFSLGNTMASVLANEFSEANGSIYISSLLEIGLLLFVVTTIISLIGRRIIKKMSVHQ
ncbi:MAG: phosphate ABC transporter permease subunit PstC [Candidatus Margulisbacteria bacterium]|nr:phosphate ABC transporter permease subunit PstC [Candidatus Margulisiibacteriota bacterium]